jgi:hypothetical protein
MNHTIFVVLLATATLRPGRFDCSVAKCVRQLASSSMYKHVFTILAFGWFLEQKVGRSVTCFISFSFFIG